MSGVWMVLIGWSAAALRAVADQCGYSRAPGVEFEELYGRIVDVDDILTIATELEGTKPKCADCGGPIGQDKGPPDGWQLEDGRTVCHSCCVIDFHGIVDAALGSPGGKN